MRIDMKKLIISIAIPLAVGGLSSLITGGGMDSFGMLNKPPLSPPGILFPIVWTILYTLMGIASYLVFISDADREEKNNALFIYGLQLAVNFFWPIFFFQLEWYLFSFFWLLLLWVFILRTIMLFYPISKTAAYLLFPYLLWVTFAGYLNLGIYFLNR